MSHRWDPECRCFRCGFVNQMVLREAIASVALDNDPRCQTISLEELNGDSPPDPDPA